MAAPISPHSWTFFRTGGLDQVALTSGADLLGLEHLDQKLWVALSCPVKGLELDEKTLALIDTDGDGRVRAPEVIAAIKWASVRLKDAGALLAGTDGLPVDAINPDTPEGRAAADCARAIVAQLGRPAPGVITVAEAAEAAKLLAATPYNGDGVIMPQAAEDEETKQVIVDIIACLGGTADRGGAAGVTREQITAFHDELAAFAAWAAREAEASPLGAATAAAAAAVSAVRAKVDDYFARCRLAAYDSRALAALNRSENEYLALAARDLKITNEEVSGFPLARIEAGRPLPLSGDVNPAWSAALAALRAAAVEPLLGGSRATLTEDDWSAVQTRVAPYGAWLSAKPANRVEKLGAARAKAILASGARARLDALIERDLAAAPHFATLSSVEKLARLHRDFRSLLCNFVNFADFYSRDRWAVFQAGTLYLDGRSTELCVRVDGPSPLAASSKTYLAYCACTRAGSAPITIAAAFTQGDSDFLGAGRRGIFYDRQGRDWDAVVTSVIDNPISVRQAFWAPYKKFVRLIEEQIAKRAAAAEAESGAKVAAAAEKTAHADKAKPAEPKKFDLALITGIGVALGSIGGFLAAIFSNFVSLGLWMPFGLVGIMLLISGPSMLIAWLKLRQRTLGPILEGNGWAVNGRVRINIPLGSALTDVAALPAGAVRSLDDPYEDREAASRRRRIVFWAIVLALAAMSAFTRWKQKKTGRYFWEPAAASAPAQPPPAKN
ncbi:MAG: hypothetical protein ACKODK_12080 [Opitutaceae bacterium]